jgi:hypothetical protein
MEKFHFSKLESNQEHNLFATALRLITEGKEDVALESLKHLYFDSQDPYLRSNCSKLLFDFYFAKCDWIQLELLGLFDEPSIEKSNRLIAKACSQSIQTEILFSNNQVIVPMKLSLTGCPMIEVEINGRKKSFWLDTGAGMTVISKTLAKECMINIMEDNDILVGNSTGKNMRTDLTFIPSIVIEDLSIQHQASLVLPDESLTMQNPKTGEIIVINGIIGWDIIQHFYLEIDYGKKEVKIKKPIPKEHVDNNLFFCGYPIVKVKSMNEDPLYFGLDTGANKTHFGESLLSKMSGLTIEKRTVHVGGVGEVKEVEIESVKELMIFLNENHPIQLQNMRKVLEEYATFFKLDGVLGSDIVQEKRLVVDYCNRRLEIV